MRKYFVIFIVSLLVAGAGFFALALGTIGFLGAGLVSVVVLLCMVAIITMHANDLEKEHQRHKNVIKRLFNDLENTAGFTDVKVLRERDVSLIGFLHQTFGTYIDCPEKVLDFLKRIPTERDAKVITAWCLMSHQRFDLTRLILHINEKRGLLKENRDPLETKKLKWNLKRAQKLREYLE